jgi:type IV pilus assembly protein PilP
MKNSALIPVKMLLVALGASLLTACSSGMSDLERYVDEVKARKPGRIEPLPEIKPIETFAYVAGDRRNPFRAEAPRGEETQEYTGSGISIDRNRRKEELEAFPLDSIRMVGTLEQSETKWGLVKTQEGIIYRVRAGNYMGQNHGQITQVSEDKIELTEIISDPKGNGYMERQATVALSE